MISIIVSSVNPELNRSFQQNIGDTIGVDFELLVHDNTETKWGLCRLYNHYASLSKYDILCFFHEDIIFHTKDWGRQIVDFLSGHPETGVIGFAGSAVKTEYHTGWESHKSATRQSLIQHFNDGNVKYISNNPYREDFSSVAILDGLALITTKAVWSANRFDEMTFKRFHLYDLDFTMQTSRHYTNYVCHTISVEHFSTGSFNQEWRDATEKFINKWKETLPYCLPSLPENLICKCRQIDSYKLMRKRLVTEGVDVVDVVDSIGQVCGLKYKVKIIKYVFKAGVKRCGFNQVLRRIKIRYA